MYEFTFLGTKHHIHNSWRATFIELTDELIMIEKLLPDTTMIKPSVDNVFRVFELDINKINVVILGQDPYPSGSDATGFAFELDGYESWLSTTGNTSIRNILKELYRTEKDSILGISEIRREIRSSRFEIFPPNRIFQEWRNNGVFLLNTSLTCNDDSPNSHKSIWACFIKKIIIKMAEVNTEVTWLLWGDEAKGFKPFIELYDSNIVKESAHPSLNSFIDSGIFEGLIDEFCVIA